MIIIFVILISGIVLGHFLRNNKSFINISERLSDWSIYLLLFFMGLTTATNEKVVDKIGEIGLLVVIITAGSVMGSILAGAIIYKKYFRGENEKQH
jgi:uncharacterized membrane protein YbjE (DUF340 family)